MQACDMLSTGSWLVTSVAVCSTPRSRRTPRRKLAEGGSVPKISNGQREAPS